MKEQQNSVAPIAEEIHPKTQRRPQADRHGMRGAIVSLRSDPRVMVSGLLIVIFILIGVFAPLITPYDPQFMDPSASLAGPSTSHLFGTDQLGRDVLSRLIYGARLSLEVSIFSVAIAFIIGVSVGVICSYFGSWVDGILMRIVDVFLAFPALVLAIAVAAFLGPSLWSIIFVIGIVYWPTFARITYVVTGAVKHMEYVESARALGSSNFRIIVRTILPNSLAPLIVQTSLSLGFAILTESGLSFLGVGVPPPAPSWGTQIAESRLTLGQDPLLVIWPAVAIALAILSFNILGDGLRDMLDPRTRGR